MQLMETTSELLDSEVEKKGLCSRALAPQRDGSGCPSLPVGFLLLGKEDGDRGTRKEVRGRGHRGWAAEAGWRTR